MNLTEVFEQLLFLIVFSAPRKNDPTQTSSFPVKDRNTQQVSMSTTQSHKISLNLRSPARPNPAMELNITDVSVSLKEWLNATGLWVASPCGLPIHPNPAPSSSY